MPPHSPMLRCLSSLSLLRDGPGKIHDISSNDSVLVSAGASMGHGVSVGTWKGRSIASTSSPYTRARSINPIIIPFFWGKGGEGEQAGVDLSSPPRIAFNPRTIVPSPCSDEVGLVEGGGGMTSRGASPPAEASLLVELANFLNSSLLGLLTPCFCVAHVSSRLKQLITLC
jgi:hypothetical protein